MTEETNYEELIKEAEDVKKMQVKLTPKQVARLQSEALELGIDIKTRLQQRVDEMLNVSIGKATITGPSKLSGSQVSKVSYPMYQVSRSDA